MTDAGRLGGALTLLRAGRYGEAERDLRALLAKSPSDAEVLQLLGIAATSQGRLEEALSCFERALAARPASLAFMQNRAQALFQLGRFGPARAQAEAMAAIDPSNAAARDLLARVLHEEGVAHHAAGQPAKAADAYARAINAGLSVPEAFANLGVALFAAGRPRESVDALQRALALRPDWDSVRNHFGNALAASGRKREALEAFAATLARNPRDADALSDRGVVLLDLGDVEGARASLSAALEARPDFPVALNNLGLVLRDQGRIGAAATFFERAVALQPGYAGAAHNLALAWLTAGRFAEGWGLYGARFRAIPPVSAWRDFPVPEFREADFGRGRRIALWREQGIGDQILYSTPLASLEARGEAFALECDPRLAAALRRAHPSWQVVTPDESMAAFAQCDRHAPIATMAGLLRPTRESFRDQPRALLAPDAARASRYRELLAAPGRRAVGISWRSFQKADRAALESRKSAPLAAFRRLAARNDVSLVDLQYGDTAEERGRFEGELNRIDGLDLFNDLEGVIAAIAACDVVVTTSSVTAHLAGACGKRTLLIYLRGVPPFHYWAPDLGGHTPWYPSVRIVASPEVDTWERAIERVDELLDR